MRRRTLHRGAKFDFEELSWEGPHGRTVKREVVRHPGAVVIVPVLPDGRLAMIRSFRPAVGARLLEFPAGTLEPPESPEACAARELVEETGHSAATLRALGRFYTSPGMSDELMHAFVALGLKFVGQDLQEDEDLEVHPVGVDEAMDMVRSGGLSDGKSIAALLMAAREGLIGG